MAKTSLLLHRRKTTPPRRPTGNSDNSCRKTIIFSHVQLFSPQQGAEDPPHPPRHLRRRLLGLLPPPLPRIGNQEDGDIPRRRSACILVRLREAILPLANPLITPCFDSTLQGAHVRHQGQLQADVQHDEHLLRDRLLTDRFGDQFCRMSR